MALVSTNFVFISCLFLLLPPAFPYYSSQVYHGSTGRAIAGSNHDSLVITRRHVPRRSLFTSISATSYHGVEYVAVIGYGTPQQNVTVLIDTGGSLCWIKCKPCAKRSDHNHPIFNPTISYSAMPCDSRECDRIVSMCSSGSNSSCSYLHRYGDGSSTSGTFGYESITLSRDVTVENFVFGCSHSSAGQLRGIGGILGLGRGILSLISQTYDIYKGVFSYCLPRSPDSTGFLKLGPSDEHRRLRFIPMQKREEDPTSYYIDLLGISVGGLRLDIPPAVFSVGGTLLDSGSLLSYLPDPAYAALRSAFRSRMRKYPLSRPYNKFLDTCYDLSSFRNITVPIIELHLGNNNTTTTTIKLDKPGNILWEGCLAFHGNGDSSSFSVIGNVQQHSFEVLYDLANELIGFRPGAC